MLQPPEVPSTPFTWSQVKVKGMTRHRLDELLAQRVVRRVLRNVYIRSDIPDTPLTRAQAAALVVSPFAVICDRTAAWIWGVDTFDYRELEILPPLESYVLRGHTRSRRPECTGGTRDLAAHDICAFDDIRVTTPLRTALDLAGKLHRRDAFAALDGFMRVHGLTREAMQFELQRYFRRRGVVQARQLVPLADPRAESPGESWTRLTIVDAGLPIPELQWWVEDRGRRVYRLDLAYPMSKVAVEYDGREHHDADEQREHDEQRREWLRRRGWTIIVVTMQSFTPDAVSAWIHELRVALRLAA